MVSSLDPGVLDSDAAPKDAPEHAPGYLLGALLILVVATQLAHIAVFFLVAHPAVASNVMQSLAAALSAAVCILTAFRSTIKRYRRLWLQLSATFLFWECGQLMYLASLFFRQGPAAILTNDVLWLALAFPLLVLAATPSQSSRHDSIGWLDTAQSCTMFVIMFVLVYPHPGIIRVPAAYDVENISMTLAILLRFSISQSGEERNLYRGALIFTSSYTLTTLLDYELSRRGVPAGTLVDLCWSIPFTTFSVMALYGENLRPRLQRWAGRQLVYPRQLHGVTAMGMALMSMAGSVVVARHSMAAGLPMLAVSFLVFAARTSTREWQLHTAHRQLEYTALHDSLTGLANRTLLRRQLASLLAGPPVSSTKRIALLFIDLDRFKTINDGLGHAFGDHLLVEVANLLQAVVGPGGIVARHGGDGFVVLLESVEEAEAEEVAQSVVKRMRHPLTLEGRTVHITVSIGLAMSDRTATADSMLQDADCAMYRAKTAGRDRAQKFAPKMLALAKGRLDLETALRQALAAGQVEVFYQPIFWLPDMSIRGFEALARWRHPHRGIISPSEFIPIAEDTGLILELSRQVLWKACHQCRAWNELYGARLRVAVNVSAHQFSDPGLLNEVLKTLRASGLEPSLLKLEVTESVLVNRYQVVEDVLTRARARGIGICLDDFGTGYSSLSYLLRFPFDVVKIDRSFVRHLDRDPRRAEMVRMIVHLAKTLNKKIVAEGVESQEELEQLRAFGADMVQGFLLSRPLTVSGVEELLRSGVSLAGPGPADVAPKSALPGKRPGIQRLPVHSPAGLLAAPALLSDAAASVEVASQL